MHLFGWITKLKQLDKWTDSMLCLFCSYKCTRTTRRRGENFNRVCYNFSILIMVFPFIFKGLLFPYLKINIKASQLRPFNYLYLQLNVNM